MKMLRLGLAGFLGLMVLAGCSNTEGVGNTNEKPPTQADIDKQLADIDANDKMPPQAKAMAKANILRNGSGQKQQGNAGTK
jgi:hypothetical protein